MYSLNVRDHFMIAHSFRGEVFGPAQRLHGATYVVDLELRRPDLDDNGIVADIGRVAELLKSVLAPLAYRNLDQLPEFEGRNTTTEVLTRTICERVRERILSDALGGDARETIGSLQVTLRESHVAWASYEMSLRDA
jgi:6-pyruvoyltetrahydropterin/6-carboxytetrahydropterin synthase